MLGMIWTLRSAEPGGLSISRCYVPREDEGIVNRELCGSSTKQTTRDESYKKNVRLVVSSLGCGS